MEPIIYKSMITFLRSINTVLRLMFFVRIVDKKKKKEERGLYWRRVYVPKVLKQKSNFGDRVQIIPPIKLDHRIPFVYGVLEPYPQ